jgi:hypothetical protein
MGLRADYSSRGVLPTVVRRCVWSKYLENKEAMTSWRLLRQKKIYMGLIIYPLHVFD